jgi:hypothetical protein
VFLLHSNVQGADRLEDGFRPACAAEHPGPMCLDVVIVDPGRDCVSPLVFDLCDRSWLVSLMGAKARGARGQVKQTEYFPFEEVQCKRAK